MSPESLVDLLNGHIADMVDVIGAYGGMVDKFMGDGILAVFGLDGAGDHSERAVCAAREMMAAVDPGNMTRPPLSMGVGLHRGPVVAGLIGSPQRLEYTVIGATVNVAARLEAAARSPNPPLLMSASVASALAGEDSPRAAGHVSLKGVSKAVEVFTVDLADPARTQEFGASE